MRGVRWKVAHRQSEKMSTAKPKPLHPLSRPESTAASSAGTSGASPRHDLFGKGQNQQATANHATMT